MAIILPHVFQDGVKEIGSGVQINENNTVLREAIEEAQARLPVATDKYSAAAALAVNTDVVLDGSHWVHAVIRISSPKQPPTIEAKVLVGGVEVAQVFLVAEEAQRPFAVSVLVAPGEAVRLNVAGAWTATVSFRRAGAA